MTEYRFAAETDEIAKIDFLLDNLARAVERGEVHRASWDVMAPRHLERRADLVAIITGVPRTVAPQPVAVRPVAPQPGVPSVAPAAGVVRPAEARVWAAPPTRTSVDWPTVLLFLGAFLVVVASAIFSVAVWGSLDTLEKVGFLGTLTAAFYGAGWWALKRLKLNVGAVALTSVASGMLLFDGWILIDGYHMEGPLPWAVLLLVCSVVYFGTEMLLAGHIFGVVGAAAQVAWWWLLGDGLGLPTPTRLAGIVLVTVAWQLAAERGRDRRSVATLASALGWAAPVVAVGCSMGLLGDLAVSGPATAQVVGAAIVVSFGAGFLAWRSVHVPRALGSPLAAVLQAPLLVAAWSAALGVGHEWWIAGVLLGAAVVYYVVAFRAGDVALAVAGLLAEASAVLEACLVLELSGNATLVVLAAFAALWALAARLIERWPISTLDEERARLLARVVEVGALALLVVVSVALPIVQWTLPLRGFGVTRVEALGYVGVLAAWWACTMARPRGISAFAGSLWAFVALSAILTWAIPETRAAALYIAPFVVLAGVWLASGSRIEKSHGPLWGELTRWSARAVALAFSVVGLTVAADRGAYLVASDALEALGALILLAVVAMGVFAADALLARSRPSAAVGAALAVTACALIARGAALTAGAGEPHAIEAVVVGLTALLVAALGAYVMHRDQVRELAPWIAASAAVVGTLRLVDGVAVPPFALAVAWVSLSGAWLFVASLTSQWVAGAAGLSIAAAAWSALGDAPSSWTAVFVIGAVGLALGAPSLTRVFGSRRRFETAGTALAIAGVLTHLHLAGYLPPGEHATAIALLLLAVNVAGMSALRRFELGYYAAGLPLVIAAWIEVGTLSEPLAVLYSTPLALYLMAVGYLYVRLGERRAYPLVLDAFTAIVGLGYPVMVSLRTFGDRSLAEAIAAVVVSLLAIGLGVGLKVRWYFFGGVVSLAIVAFYRSFWAIAEYWWLVLGLVGIAMLAIALTWQRQRLLMADARSWLHRSFEDWR